MQLNGKILTNIALSALILLGITTTTGTARMVAQAAPINSPVLTVTQADPIDWADPINGPAPVAWADPIDNPVPDSAWADPINNPPSIVADQADPINRHSSTVGQADPLNNPAL